MPAPFSLLNLKWMYCYQGPCIIKQYPEALGALLAEAHAIAKCEQAIMMRIEAPRDVRDSDAYLWHCTLQRLRHGLNRYASDWAKAQGLLRYEMYIASSGQHKPAVLPGKQAHVATNSLNRPEMTEKVQVECRNFGCIYDFVYRPFFYQLWTFISHGHLPSSAQAFQQMRQQVADAATVPLHV
jgi:hypothetical protein